MVSASGSGGNPFGGGNKPTGANLSGAPSPLAGPLGGPPAVRTVAPNTARAAPPAYVPAAPTPLRSSLIRIAPAPLEYDFRTPATAESAAAPPSAFGNMPPQLLERLSQIQEWAKGNRKESRRETVLFWSLKIPVILATAGSAIFVKYNLDLILTLVGAASAFCVLIDGLACPGALRNVHHKAYFELTTLVDNVATRWQRGTLDAGIDRIALSQQLFDEIIKKSGEIADYLRDAEATDKGATVSTAKKP